MKNCKIENCPKLVKERSKSPFCPNCRASIGAWSRRPVAHIRNRVSNLERFSDRMTKLGRG